VRSSHPILVACRVNSKTLILLTLQLISSTFCDAKIKSHRILSLESIVTQSLLYVFLFFDPIRYFCSFFKVKFIKKHNL